MCVCVTVCDVVVCVVCVWFVTVCVGSDVVVLVCVLVVVMYCMLLTKAGMCTYVYMYMYNYVQVLCTCTCKCISIRLSMCQVVVLSLLLLCVPTSGDVLLDAVMLVYMYISIHAYRCVSVCVGWRHCFLLLSQWWYCAIQCFHCCVVVLVSVHTSLSLQKGASVRKSHPKHEDPVYHNSV